MPCYSPLKGYRSVTVNPNGKRSIVFSPARGLIDLPVDVPCGQCVGCRLERSRQWAVRCVHEAQLYERNCFITLTYNDVSLPADRSLDVRHFQLFMKRLRKRFGASIRFYHCGEYGDLYGRPHYHSCIFNFDFPDKVLWKVSQGNRLYVSAILAELWPFGFSSIGDVTFESAAYVARYIMKKINGDGAAAHYRVYDSSTGEVFDRRPEYTTMSRRPGIGKGWLDKFQSDVFPRDYVVVRGVKCKPPRFYDSQFEVIDPDLFNSLKMARVRSAKKHVDNNTWDRLRVREQVKLAQISTLTRKLD